MGNRNEETGLLSESHDTLLIGWDSSGKVIFCKTVDSAKRPEFQNWINFIMDKNNCANYLMGDPQNILKPVE